MTRKYSTRFLKRKFVDSDAHAFIGRIYDLSIVEMHFETYDEIASYPDCKYAFDCNKSVSNLTRRVESLNKVGDLLWVDPDAWSEGKQAIDRYFWLNVASDLLLVRLISVHDCILHLVNDVFELCLKKVMYNTIKEKNIPNALLDLLKAQREDHQGLRTERNDRIHEGWERTHSSCDTTFWMASLFEHRSGGTGYAGKDSHGRRINLNRYMKEGLVDLQRDYNTGLKVLSSRLNQIYDCLHPEFDQRFGSKYNDPDSGFGCKIRTSRKT